MPILSSFPQANWENGAVFTPSVSEDGTLSWSNDKGLENPEPINIKGKSVTVLYGTEVPSGGVHGDIYIQIIE